MKKEVNPKIFRTMKVKIKKSVVSFSAKNNISLFPSVGQCVSFRSEVNINPDHVRLYVTDKETWVWKPNKDITIKTM
jgi:predicted sulfurtransferase